MTEPDAPARRLVVSYCFPPYSDTAAIVAAKRVRERGEPVDVIYNAMDSIRRQDPDLVRITGHLVRRSVAAGSSSRFSGWSAIADFERQAVESALRWEQLQGAYESMYSRAHFPASHFGAASLKLLRPDLVWDAEFSDPLSRDVLGHVREAEALDDGLLGRLRDGIREAGFRPPEGLNALEWCEAVPFALADSVMFTNENQRDYMLEHCHDPALAKRVASIAVVSPHPTLPAEFYSEERSEYPLDRGVRHIGYFGNFYANRGVQGVLDAMRRLPDETRERLRFHIFTGQREELEEEVARVQLEATVQVNPFVGFLEYLDLCRRMDCLLVNDAVTREGEINPFLPSKWSDYRGSGSPVWGVVEEGSALNGQPLDYRSPIGHTTAAMQVLARVAAG